MSVDYGISIPQFYPEGSLDFDELSLFVRDAERLGFHSGWVQEEILNAPALDAIGLLSFVATQTTTLKLGTAILVTTTANPLYLAKSLTTLDLVSKGRLIVGVGLGSHTSNYPAYDVPLERRAARFSEGLRLMKRLWTEDAVEVDGEHWKFHGERMLPKPYQRPHPPMWLGGSARPALERAVKIGNGWIGGRTSAADFAGHVATLHELLAVAGRDPADFGIAKRVYITVTNDKKRTEERLADWFNLVYGRPEMAQSVMIYGSEQECIERVAAFKEAGAKLLFFNPVFDLREQMEILATRIIPALGN
jgi:probable F420-dependent oxidoreductase